MILSLFLLLFEGNGATMKKRKTAHVRKTVLKNLLTLSGKCDIMVSSKGVVHSLLWRLLRHHGVEPGADDRNTVTRLLSHVRAMKVFFL